MPYPDDDFVALYSATRRRVWQYVRRRVSGDEQCEDICAEVFELAYRKLPHDHPHPVGWLINCAAIAVQQSARLNRREAIAMRDHVVVAAPDDPDPRLAELEAAWERLGAGHREVLRLIIWDRLSAADAAVTLGCTEQAVWKRVSRARRALREAWPTEEHSDSTKEVAAWVSTRNT